MGRGRRCRCTNGRIIGMRRRECSGRSFRMLIIAPDADAEVEAEAQKQSADATHSGQCRTRSREQSIERQAAPARAPQLNASIVQVQYSTVQ